MMKILILTFLVVLALQSVITLPYRNPLRDRSFSIAYNQPGNKHINGVEVFFTSSGIDFKGCNSNWNNYKLKFSGEFSITGKWASTKIACRIDFDSNIRKLFDQTTQIHQLKSGRVNFYKGTQLLLILRPIITIQPVNQLTGKNLIIQSTSLGIDAINRIEVSFTDNTVSFKGCNTNTASYSISLNGEFSIDSIWISTQIACQVDYDSSVTHLFSSSIRYTLRLDGGVTFFDYKDVSIQLRPKIMTQSFLLNPLIGKNFIIAETSLKNDGIIIGTVVGFTRRTLQFKGCNYNYAQYSTTFGNKISVSDRWRYTEMFCLIDQDRSIRQLFTNSKNYKRNQNNSVSFYDAKSKLTLRLQLKPADIIPRGSYAIKSNWLNIESINGVIVNFNDKSISFKQCNINFAGYQIYGKRQFKINSGWISTNLFCQDDHDTQIQSFFDNAYLYSPRGSEIHFVDQTGKTLVVVA